MHKIQRREYVGQPGEVVRVETAIQNGGRVRVELDGQDLGNVRTFSLPNAPAPDRNLRINLAGPLNASCGVGISTVDGGTDPDFLLCQAFNPAPSSAYVFKVAPASSVAAFGAIKGLAPARAAKRARKATRKPVKRQTRAMAKAKKGGRKR